MKVRKEVFDTYWKFAAERQSIFFKKFRGDNPPFTTDPILGTYKFCNVYRASDRVSQFLIKNVIYADDKLSEPDILFRIFLFRLLNRIETWNRLEKVLGQVKLSNFTHKRYSKLLNEFRNSGQPIYGNAFILCANKVFGYDHKHDNHLALLEKVFLKDNLYTGIIQAKNLEGLFKQLRGLPLIGNFMSYQIAIDFNYSEVFNFDEDDFTIAGPGALRGIRKCFEETNEESDKHVIMYMVENQEKEFARLGLQFKNLWGRHLHAIDCQGLFCEVDKYSRVKFPNLKSNRLRIKTRYKSGGSQISYFYPPKWKINSRINEDLEKIVKL